METWIKKMEQKSFGVAPLSSVLDS